LIHGGVVGEGSANERVGVEDGRQVAQDLRQLRFAELAGSTGAVAQAGQPGQ
jgi:hypothetical protein